MTGDQLVEIEITITDLIAQLEKQIAQAKEGSAAPVQLDGSIGRLSRADALLSQEMAKDSLRRMEARLPSLREALERLDRGDYGFCARCGGDIEFERLELQPEAMICKRCAEHPGASA